MEYSEFSHKSCKGRDRASLSGERLPAEIYELYHRTKIVACHDAFIEYRGGILLVERDNLPAKGELWPVGGAMKRGLSAEDSLIEKVKEECGLKMANLQFLGVARTLFSEDPFGHGNGTDTLNLIYFGEGEGEVKLDHLHSGFRIIGREEYAEIREELDEYVRNYMDLAVRRLV